VVFEASLAGQGDGRVALNSSAASLMGINVRAMVVCLHHLERGWPAWLVCLSYRCAAYSLLGVPPGLKVIRVAIIGGLGNHSAS